MKEVKDRKEIEEIMKSSNPKCVFFYAAWCPHCKVMHEPWSKLEKKHKDKKFYKMESEDIPEELGISGYPRFVLIKNGKVVKTVDGEMSEEDLEKALLSGGGRRRRNRTRRLRRGTRKAFH
jgi:thiol-disulfide isomerase/thioredoxin